MFPPYPLVSKVVAKLENDRAHGVALLPHRPDANWWRTVQRGAGKRMRSFTAEEALTTDFLTDGTHASAYTHVNWRLVCFDFSSDGARVYTQCDAVPEASPTCSPDELDHRRFLNALLLFQGASV